MEFKGTKGEWVLAETPTVNCKSIKTKSGEYVGMLSLNVVRPALMSEQKLINEANAKLIACAPEMLEMLKKSNEVLSDFYDTLDFKGRSEIRILIDMNREIIKKATK